MDFYKASRSDRRRRYSTGSMFREKGKENAMAAFGHNPRTGLIPLDGDLLAARGGVTLWVVRAL